MSKKIIAAIGVLVLVLGAAGLFLQDSNSQVNCEEVYNQTVDGEMPADQIPEQCRPLPEDVEKKVLLRALGG